MVHDAGTVDDALLDVAGEAGRMVYAEADVFIEVKEFNAGPIDGARGSQAVEKFDLRSAGSGEQADNVLPVQQLSERVGGVPGGGDRHVLLCREDFDHRGVEVIVLAECYLLTTKCGLERLILVVNSVT